MTYAARVDLNTSLPLFMQVLREDLVTTRSELDKKITARARTVRLNPGTRAFLERAALLHADAVFLASRFPPPPDDAPPIQKPRPAVVGDLTPVADDRTPPLLTNERAVLTRDGQAIGETRTTWHLPFARSLLDGVVKEDTAFVTAWYHAVCAYLFANGMNGDATSHLARAARVLPDDALALFDRATYAETFGLPIYQAVRNAPAPTRPGSLQAGIPAEDKTNAEAERLYRRALETEPSLVEARVRLARLLEHGGRADEAAAEIARALALQPSGVPGFYARIVAGRIATARGHYDEAAQHYRAASALFAHAQSAILGESHATLMGGDVPQALPPLGQLAGTNSDPWWDYQLGAGRDAASLIAALRVRLATPADRGVGP
jgi:tetratricopeptide (TPR) repeat protein